MDRLYFTSLSDVFAKFLEIKTETHYAIQSLNEVTKDLNRFAGARNYLGTSNVKVYHNSPKFKAQSDIFNDLYNRMNILVSRFKFGIVPPSLSELHNLFVKLGELHLEGCKKVIEFLENGDISILPQAMNLFEESNNNLIIFEKMQRNIKI